MIFYLEFEKYSNQPEKYLRPYQSPNLFPDYNSTSNHLEIQDIKGKNIMHEENENPKTKRSFRKQRNVNLDLEIDAEFANQTVNEVIRHAVNERRKYYLV